MFRDGHFIFWSVAGLPGPPPLTFRGAFGGLRARGAGRLAVGRGRAARPGCVRAAALFSLPYRLPWHLDPSGS